MTRLVKKIDLAKLDELEQKLRSQSVAARIGVEKELIVIDAAIHRVEATVPVLDLICLDKVGDN